MSVHMMEQSTARQLMFLVTLAERGSAVAKGIVGDLTIEDCKNEEKISPILRRISKPEAAELIRKSKKEARDPFVDWSETLIGAFAHIANIPADTDPLPAVKLAVLSEPYKFRKIWGLYAGKNVKINGETAAVFEAPNVGGAARQRAFLKFLRGSLKDRDYEAEIVA